MQKWEGRMGFWLVGAAVGSRGRSIGRIGRIGRIGLKKCCHCPGVHAGPLRYGGTWCGADLCSGAASNGSRLAEWYTTPQGCIEGIWCGADLCSGAARNGSRLAEWYTTPQGCIEGSGAGPVWVLTPLAGEPRRAG